MYYQVNLLHVSDRCTNLKLSQHKHRSVCVYKLQCHVFNIVPPKEVEAMIVEITTLTFKIGLRSKLCVNQITQRHFRLQYAVAFLFDIHSLYRPSELLCEL